ncbi:flap endonuclease GEN [Mytilus galloprovincialis]|uniref:Flap endonuclease GEN n=1 Tax=Mytilus galloprovincialis TaxID=29158 RepID=A0A8B6G9T7_MYTGA|nr:flap endonuclease GEN [Mytilus galloprovincialis]
MDKFAIGSRNMPFNFDTDLLIEDWTRRREICEFDGHDSNFSDCLEEASGQENVLPKLTRRSHKMGVTNLWQILSPVQQHKPLSSLKGQTVAIDLSIWVCENQCVKQMQGVVTRPYLRNLYFRISCLLQLGINLIFAVEGEAPDLKHETMSRRQEVQYPGKRKGPPNKKKSRSHFNAKLRECCEMLDYLGVPYIQSKGEAEALCGLLNAAGIVDGCITNDGDVFLYGAKTVFRNFSVTSKDPQVEIYSICDIEQKLDLNREKMVALALLVGCDYVPKGVQE